MVGTGALLGACGGTAASGPAPTVMDAAMAGTDAAVAADVPPMPRGIPALGGFRHTPDSVRVREVATADDGLDRPRDLAFHPARPDQLWITNFGSNSITVLINPGKANRTADTRGAAGADHFLVQPSAIAFGDNNFFATAQETDRITQRMTPADFMGPTLWDSDLDIFNGGHASHLDMLHNSPNSNGIAWETGNVYWVVDGAHRALARYDFGEPHPHGGEDHSDGILRRYAEGMLRFMPGVSAHIEYDHSNNRLYVTQPATNQVLMFDPAEATMGTRIAPNYDGTRQNRMNGGTMQPFINGAEHGLMRPSGLALVGDTFYIADHGNSTITAFNREGQRIDWVDLSTHAAPGSLQGIAVDGRGYIYVTDAENDRILEIAPADAP
jgi:DNA-binding beta-propeller fold protein YncE